MSIVMANVPEGPPSEPWNRLYKMSLPIEDQGVSISFFLHVSSTLELL